MHTDFINKSIQQLHSLLVTSLALCEMNSSVSYVRPIWLASLMCEGSESNVSVCGSELPVGYASLCTHSDDAALTCEQPGEKLSSQNKKEGLSD